MNDSSRIDATSTEQNVFYQLLPELMYPLHAFILIHYYSLKALSLKASPYS